MPTPKKTVIPLRMLPSPGLTSVNGKDVVGLPCDIAPGAVKRINGELWTRIKPAHQLQPHGAAFRSVSRIQLVAIVPDLERVLPHFEYFQQITIQYPVKLVTDEFKWLDAIPQGSSCDLQWSVSPSTEFGAREKLINAARC
jgi:hypothetical protein